MLLVYVYEDEPHSESCFIEHALSQHAHIAAAADQTRTSRVEKGVNGMINVEAELKFSRGFVVHPVLATEFGCMADCPVAEHYDRIQTSPHFCF
jgi:hypothetical protein